MNSELSGRDPWLALGRFTAARIALGRSGGSQRTPTQLAFALDHALARDAVHAKFDVEALAVSLRPLGAPVVMLTSAAPDRATFLQRPDLGRKLSADSATALETRRETPGPDLVIIVSNGLSAIAAERQTLPLLAALLPRLHALEFSFAPLCLVRHARVAIMDEVGTTLGARLALILLGERPGLGTPDSLGAYLGFDPKPGRTNADRNCVSNIHPGGLSAEHAAEKIATLLALARQRRVSGVTLKELDSVEPTLRS
jgi:ethanolamine ammonia-lyase small subunit